MGNHFIKSISLDKSRSPISGFCYAQNRVCDAVSTKEIRSWKNPRSSYLFSLYTQTYKIFLALSRRVLLLLNSVGIPWKDTKIVSRNRLISSKDSVIQRIEIILSQITLIHDINIETAKDSFIAF